MSETGRADSILKFSPVHILFVRHILIVQVTLKKRTRHVPFVRSKTRCCNKCQENSDVTDGMRLEMMLVCCQASGQ